MLSPTASSYTEPKIECRNCHDTEPAEFIAPCRCAGSIKYVHRKCLDDWRAFSPNPSSFTTCDVCHYRYVLKAEAGEGECASKFRFGMYITRDLLGVALLFQAIIVLLAVVVHFADSGNQRFYLFPENWSILAKDYVSGLLVFFFFLGVYGIFFGLYWCCSGGSNRHSNTHYHYVTYDTYPYNWGFYYYWFWLPPGPGFGNVGCCPCFSSPCPTCDCSNCGNFKMDGDSSVYGIGLLIVLALIVTIGVIVGLVFLTILVSRIFHRHIHILQKVREARKSVVVDLEAEGIDPNTQTDNDFSGIVVIRSEVDPSSVESMSVPYPEKKALLPSAPSLL